MSNSFLQAEDMAQFRQVFRAVLVIPLIAKGWNRIDPYGVKLPYEVDPRKGSIRP